METVHAFCSTRSIKRDDTLSSVLNNLSEVISVLEWSIEI